MEDNKPLPVEGVNVTGPIAVPKLDVKQYIGKKVEIAAANVYEGKYGYYVRVTTEVVDTLGKDTPITASKVFGLVNVDGVIGWDEEGKLAAFLKAHKVEHFRDLVGKTVIVQTEQRGDKEFLTF